MTEIIFKPIKRAILSFEKKEELWPPSYLGNQKHQSSLDGKEITTRKFKIKVILGIPSTFTTGGYIIYSVIELETGIEYEVTHYFPNRQFDRSYGWYIEKVKK